MERVEGIERPEYIRLTPEIRKVEGFSMGTFRTDQIKAVLYYEEIGKTLVLLEGNEDFIIVKESAHWISSVLMAHREEKSVYDGKYTI